MLTREQLLTLFEYSLWADERLLDACASLTPEQFVQDRKSTRLNSSH